MLLIDISPLLHISLNAEISILRWQSNDAFLVFRVSKRDWLSVRTVMLVCFVNSSVKFDRNIAESQALDMASVSAARFERTTRHNLVEFHERGTTLLLLLLKKMIYPPWLPLPGRLLKLASAKTVIERDLKSSFGMLMELGVLLINLITLFTDRVSASVAFDTSWG